jgi:hypothetical protein
VIHVMLNDATPGMELACPVMASGDQILLGHGTQLTPPYIKRLQQCGIRRVWVRDSRLSGVEALDTFLPSTRSRLAARCREALRIGLHNPSGIMPLISQAAEAAVAQARSSTRNLLVIPDECPSETPLLGHSIRVGLIAAGLGAAMHMRDDHLLGLTVGALLHDIGHMQAADNAIALPADLDARLPEHTTVGFQALSRTWQLSSVVPAVCIQHHERDNGRGTPKGLRGPQIHDFARIVSVADAYDDMAYGAGMLPHLALERIVSLGGDAFDRAITGMLSQHLVPYPPGTPLALSTGEQAVVLAVPLGNPIRPIVRLLLGRGEVRDVPLADCPFIRIEAESWRMGAVGGTA